MLPKKNINLNPLNEKIENKYIGIVEDHQYALLIWGRHALAKGKSYTLVSIDYHPDTNPSFWLYAYQKTMAKDPEREEVLLPKYQNELLKAINPKDIGSLVAVMDHMRNDEQINTGIKLGYLNNYHMINGMEKHDYREGTHYLVPQESYGSLKDETFSQIGFSAEVLKETPFILDIDLDYFMELKNFDYAPSQMRTFSYLVKQAEIITIARSESYFNYLRQGWFGIDQCQEGLLLLIKEILSKDE
ncbi:MAG: UPF0489 family protein [Eubacteriaceae bacterium]